MNSINIIIVLLQMYSNITIDSTNALTQAKIAEDSIYHCSPNTFYSGLFLKPFRSLLLLRLLSSIMVMSKAAKTFYLVDYSATLEDTEVAQVFAFDLGVNGEVSYAVIRDVILVA